MKAKTKKILWWAAAVLVVLLVAGAVYVARVVRRLPPDLMADVRAGVAARHITDPDARLAKYLENRYGSMDDPAHRRDVFTNFFNPEHIKSMQILVKHSPPAQRKANIQSMAKWIHNYRESMTPQERADLAAHLQHGGGQALLAQATAQYNSQDVAYRGLTAPVISELLNTIASLQQH
jgi:hypothetical protein